MRILQTTRHMRVYHDEKPREIPTVRQSNREKVAKKREMCLLMQGGGGERAALALIKNTRITPPIECGPSCGELPHFDGIL